MTTFLRGRLLNAEAITLIEVASGILTAGGSLPTTIAAGDRIILVAVTDHDIVSRKAITTVPTGFVLQASRTAGDYIPDLHVYVKQAELVDRGRTISFGGGGLNGVRQIQYVIARGGGAITVGPAGFSYFSSAVIPAVDKTGLHIISSAMSGDSASINAGPGTAWALRGDGTTFGTLDYGASVLWTRNGGPLGDVTISASGTGDISINGFEIAVEGVAVPTAPSAPTITGTAGDAQTSLSWAPVNAYPLVTSYTVQRWNGSAWVTLGTTPGTTYTDTGLTNGANYQYAVTATNSVGTSPRSNSVTLTPAAPSGLAPAAPNLDTTGAIALTSSSDIQAAINAAATGAVFTLAAGTYTAHDLFPKQGQRFIATGAVTFDGQSTYSRAFRGDADDVTIHGIDFVDWTNGVYDQFAAVIDCKADAGTEGSLVVAHDWYVDACTFDTCKVGIAITHRGIIRNCTFEGCNPQAISSGFSTGGWIHGCTFRDNGYVGGGGAGANAAQIKLHWHNIGPWGDTANDTSRFCYYGSNTLFGANAHNYEPPALMYITNNTFIGTRNTAKYGAGDGARALWMDIDVRDVRITGNTFTDTWYFGVFAEGCNGIEIDNNLFDKCRTPFFDTQTTGVRVDGPYWGQGAVVTDCSDNVDVHDNIFDDCAGTCTFFLGDRGRPPADWVTAEPTGWPIASDDRNQMIRRTYGPITRGKASTVGSSNCTMTNNVIRNGSYGVGWIPDDGNLTSEYNLATFNFQGNDYQGGDTGVWFWNRQRYTSLAAWKSATGFDL